MNRRELLKSIGLLLGTSISAPVAAAVLEVEGRQRWSDNWQPRTLSPDQDRLVTAIAEAIIPATDTPGATAVGVNQFIDLLLSEWLEQEAVARFLVGLDNLDSSSVQATGKPFVDLPPEAQIQQLLPLDQEAIAFRSAAWEEGADPAAGQPFFAMLKEMTIVGYYTSEIGMTQELRLPEITSSYSGCVPYEEIGRSWA